MSIHNRWAGIIVAVVGLSPAACLAAGQDATAYLRRASAAMGADGIDGLRFIARGSGNVTGQSYGAGNPGAKVTIHSFTRTMIYSAGAISDEIVRSTAENPFRGGGAVPAFEIGRASCRERV